MTITRRTVLGAAAIQGLLWLAMPAALASDEPAVADNGLFTQPFFIETFLEFADDHAEAAAEGKGLVVIFEQRGCPYCREMHRVNFADPQIADFVSDHFNVIQLDMWGSREVTDFDGEQMEEKALARKWGVNFTPTLVFFAADADVAGKPGNTVESARLPGYFKPFHFLSMFEFVDSGAWRDEPFQRFLQQKGERLREQGKEVDLW
ncbi:thioredoxin family protein [Microbaculum marinum]|uniref:Thioredoxin family protein n=1 Tax=Microbaculum marinum TaxID=1764581 RepID=A0AAW9RMY3_9HYPH